MLKDLAPEGAILVPRFILRSKDCHDEVFITSLQRVIKRPLKDNTCSSTVYLFYGP